MDIKEAIYTYVNEDPLERNLSVHTVKNRRNLFKRILSYLGDQHMTLETVKNYIDAMRKRGVTPISIKDEIRMIKAFTNYCHQRGYLEDNWGKQLLFPKVPRRPEGLVSAEMTEECIIAGTTPGSNDHTLHRQHKAEMRFAMRFLLRTGIRIGEMLQIKGSDLYMEDDEPRVLLQGKSGNQEYQPIPHDMLDEIKLRINRGKVFVVQRDTMNRLLRKGAKEVGIPSNIHMHIHMLRKIYGCTLVKNQIHMSLVSRLMRHSSMSVTQEFYLLYGLNELSAAQNSGHSLIRLAMTENSVLENFVDKTVKNYFKNDSRFSISSMPDPSKRELILRIVY